MITYTDNIQYNYTIQLTDCYQRQVRVKYVCPTQFSDSFRFTNSTTIANTVCIKMLVPCTSFIT